MVLANHAMQGLQTMKAMQGYGMQGMHVLGVGVFVFVFCSSVSFAERSELGRARDFSRRVPVSGRTRNPLELWRFSEPDWRLKVKPKARLLT